jgi:TonB family protein
MYKIAALVCSVFIPSALPVMAQDPVPKETPVVSTAPAQSVEPRTVPQQIMGGVLNGKAISLPKPKFPPAARAVGASGAVSVQVLIDENGDVVSAAAVSGHPLLRAASVEAAREAKFSPTQLSGQPVKVAGVITYNFVGPLFPARLAFLLTHADRTGTFGTYSMPESIAWQMPPDWIQEKEILDGLTYEEIPVVARKVEEAKPPVRDEIRLANRNDENRYTIIGAAPGSKASAVYAKRKLDARSVSSLKSLLPLAEERSSADPASKWAYELGTAIGAFVAEIDDNTKADSNIATIESLIDRAPANAIQSSVRNVRDFVELYRTENISDANRQQIIDKAVMLSNIRY